MVNSQTTCKHIEPPRAKCHSPWLFLLYLLMALSTLRATRAEEKSFITAATVTALYDNWDATSSSLQSLLHGSYKAKVCLENNAGTSGLSGTKGFRVDFGQTYSLELAYIQNLVNGNLSYV